MGRQRPWKVYFHHDGTKKFSSDEAMQGSYTIDTSKPIDGKSSHATEAEATATAVRVSRNGGEARIMLYNSTTGVESPISAYGPYEVAMVDLVERQV